MPAYIGLSTKVVQLRGHDGDTINAYVATPDTQERVPGVVVIHHMPGWDEWSMEVTRRFAHHGFAAICPNLHARGGEGTMEEVIQRVRDAGGVNDAQSIGDLQAAVDELLASPLSNGKVGIIGFCSGGRICYMASAKLDNVHAAVDCWGGNVAKGEVTDLRPQHRRRREHLYRLRLLVGTFNSGSLSSRGNRDSRKSHPNRHEFRRFNRRGSGVCRPDS